jgi:hypothetical protein
MLGTALAGVLLCVAALEVRLALRGFQPTVEDSADLWLEQRARATALGERALVLVGSSRIQLDTDLDALRRLTGLEPVQLAIDGSSFRPVFAGLAADLGVRGTVIVDFSDHLLAQPPPQDVAQRWQAAYDRGRERSALPDFESSERRLQRAVRSRLRSYADGAQPFTSLLVRALSPRATPQYLVMRADRSRAADYRKVEMPGFYYARVLRNLGQAEPAGMATWEQLDRELATRIAALPPRTGELPAYEQAGRALAAQAAAIRERGGRVLFVMLPKSGLVRALDERRYPPAQFWNRFVAIAGPPAVHFEDVPGWRGLECPDGSHLDYRDRAAFTAALVEALGLGR